MTDEGCRSRTNWMQSGLVRPIQVPMAIGAMRAGVDRGAEMLDEVLRTRVAKRNRPEIVERLQESWKTPVASLESSDTRHHAGVALELEGVAEASEHLGRSVSQAIKQGELALILGGDHAASVGSVAGAALECERLAVVWIDAHADMNWPRVSLTGRLHGMSLGASMGRGAPELTDLFGKNPKVHPRDAYLIGIRLLDPGEEAWFQEGECNLVTMPDVDAMGVDNAIEHIIEKIMRSGADAVHLSFDLDSLDPSVFCATGTPVRGGFTYREASRILRLFRDSDLPVRSMDWVELNPDLDPKGESTEVAADLLGIALGEEMVRPIAGAPQKHTGCSTTVDR